MHEYGDSKQLSMAEKRVFFHNMKMLVLFMIPVAYLAIICAVMVHEIIGHGFITVLLGGKFTGFGILVDGMGWAAIDFSSMKNSQQMLVLLAGAFFTNLFSIVFFILTNRLKKQYLISMLFLIFALAFLMDGVPYFFWDAIYIGGIGDISNILKLYPSDLLRGITITLMGLFGITGIVVFNYNFYTRTVSRFAAKGMCRLSEKILIAVILFVFQAVGWFSFDWKQLVPVPGVGGILSVIPTALTFIVLSGILLREGKKRHEAPEAEQLRWKAPILTAWGVCIVLITIIIFRLQNGIFF